MGMMSAQSAALSDSALRKKAAEDIFTIETQHLHLIDDEDKRNEQYAQAERKRADEIYHAKEQYEIALQTLRERDMQKYEQMAGSLFDALRTRSTSQWGREMLIGQARQMFSNATTGVLQHAGQTIGGMIPGQTNPDGTKTNIGKLLSGTMLDSSNTAAKDTATHTKDTVDQIKGLRGDLAHTGVGNPAGSIGGAEISGGVADIFNLPLSKGNSLSSLTGLLLGGGGSTTANGMSALFNAGSGSTVSQFMSGLGAASLEAAVTGWSGHGSTGTKLTSKQRAGAAVAEGAQMAAEGVAAYQGFKSGGARGGLQGASGVLGMASAIPGPQQPFLGAAAIGTSMVAALLGDPRTKRAGDIFNELSRGQYLAPTALNVQQSMDGTYSDFDARGNLRTSSMSAVPTVNQPYITSRVTNGQRTYYDVNGAVTSPYSGGATGTGVAPVAGTTVNIYGGVNAMDSESFHAFVNKTANAHAIGEATASHLERHEGRLSNAIRYVAGA